MKQPIQRKDRKPLSRPALYLCDLSGPEPCARCFQPGRMASGALCSDCEVLTQDMTDDQMGADARMMDREFRLTPQEYLAAYLEEVL